MPNTNSATNRRAHSAAWLGSGYERLGQMHSEYATRTPEYAMHMASLRRGIANFVRIVTGKDIPVHFSKGEQSFATKDRVIIAANDDPDLIDVNVGLALHEGAHILLSQKTECPDSVPLYEFLDVWKRDGTMFLTNEVVEHAIRLNKTPNDVLEDFKLVMNFLEDRRIDQWMYHHAPGYRPYYEALYDELWHSAVIDKALQSPLTHRPLLTNYRLHIINMTNANAIPNALPRLQEIWSMVNLSQISRFTNDPRWDTWQKSKSVYSGGIHRYDRNNLPEMMSTALKIVDIMYSESKLWNEVEDEDDVLVRIAQQKKDEKSSKVGKTKTTSQTTPTKKTFDDLDEDDEVNFDSPDQTTGDQNPEGEAQSSGAGDLPNEDVEDSENIDESSKPTLKQSSESQDEDEVGVAKARRPFNEDKLKKALKKQQDMLNGKVAKQKMSEATAQNIEAIEAVDASITSVGEGLRGKANAIMYRRLTEGLLRSPMFPFASRTNDGRPKMSTMAKKAVEQGERMGNMLAHRLRIMADDYPLTFTRQQHGKLDRRLVAGLGYDVENVFSHTIIERRSPVLVHLSVDASGSMLGVKWEKSIMLAAMLARAAEKVPTLNVVVSLRSGNDRNSVDVAVVYDSRVDKFTKVRQMFPYLHPHNGTPEGLAFEAMKPMLLAEDSKTRQFFVNISDGEPSWTWKSVERVTYNKKTRGVGYVEQETATTCFQDYSGEKAWKHTSQQVQALRDAGITVLSYFVSNPDERSTYWYDPTRSGMSKDQYIRQAFTTMYGRDAAFVEVTNLIDVARTLNKMFLSE